MEAGGAATSGSDSVIFVALVVEVLADAVEPASAELARPLSPRRRGVRRNQRLRLRLGDLLCSGSLAQRELAPSQLPTQAVTVEEVDLFRLTLTSSKKTRITGRQVVAFPMRAWGVVLAAGADGRLNGKSPGTPLSQLQPPFVGLLQIEAGEGHSDS